MAELELARLRCLTTGRTDSMNAIRNGNPRPQRRRPPAGRPGPQQRPRQNGSNVNAHRNYERYLALAREASLSGDRVEMENCYQHAEHYFRVINNRA
jgi:Domain of unknown function (DUF4167)